MKAVLTINGNIVEIEGTWEEFIDMFSSIGGTTKPEPTNPPKQKESYAKFYHDALEMSLKAFVASHKASPIDDITSMVIEACKAKEYDLEPGRVKTAIRLILDSLKTDEPPTQ